MSFVELKHKLASGEFDILVGRVEDEHFDAKSGKYDFSSDRGRLELTKDVSSFANRSGGIIVIGAKTTDDPLFYGRRVESISLFPFSLINPPDYHNVIKDWMYPRPDNIEIEWIPSKSEPNKGLVYIFIPDQPDNLRPFLIRKDIDPTTNRKRKEILFGYVERISHTSDPVTVENLHTMLRLGKENRWKENVGNRLASIESKLSESPEEKERKINLEQIILSRIGKSIDACGLTDYRTYSLAISPTEQTEVRSILTSTPDSIAKTMEEPPQLRYGGWAMETGDRAKIIGGELRRVKNDEYKILDLYRDGTLIFACRADEALLGWGHTFGKTRINPIALVEVTYMFFNFYELVLKKLEPSVQQYRVWIQFRNLHENGLITSLAPYGINTIAQLEDFYRRNAPESNYSGQVSIDITTFTVSKAALEVLREIYGWFGIEQDKIPYLTDDFTGVDEEKIKNPKKH